MCPLCEGTLRIIAEITDPDVIQKILHHMRGHLGHNPITGICYSPPILRHRLIKRSKSPTRPANWVSGHYDYDQLPPKS